VELLNNFADRFMKMEMSVHSAATKMMPNQMLFNI